MSHNAMHHPHTTAPIDLPRRALFKVPLDGDPRDFIVEAGECFSTHAHTQAIVYALQAAVVLVQPHRPPAEAIAPVPLPSRTGAAKQAQPGSNGRPLWPGTQHPVAIR